jgi:eukaryotic-like serine/threonine-protein kinase
MSRAPRIPLAVVHASFPEAAEIEFLDAGGQSDVWKVVIDGRTEILRVLVRASNVGRIRREMAALRSIDSEYVMHVYDVRDLEYEDAIHKVVRAEFIDGPSLDQAQQSSPSHGDVIRCSAGVLRALLELHARDLVHRDIKPQNIILRFGDWHRPVVLDLGYIRDLVGPTLTEYPVRIGTLQFMAPEQLRLEPAVLRSDVYALGITLFLLGSGTHPFVGTDEKQLEVDEVLRRMEAPEWPDWERLATTASSGLRALVSPMLAFQPYERPSARKALQRVESHLEREP